jgi:hypothetical protein
MMKLNSFLIDNVGLVAVRDLVLRVVCFRSGNPNKTGGGSSLCAGHWIQQERPHEINDLFISFLKGL